LFSIGRVVDGCIDCVIVNTNKQIWSALENSNLFKATNLYLQAEAVHSQLHLDKDSTKLIVSILSEIQSLEPNLIVNKGIDSIALKTMGSAWTISNQNQEQQSKPSAKEWSLGSGVCWRSVCIGAT